jgi:hypothetical protein
LAALKPFENVIWVQEKDLNSVKDSSISNIQWEVIPNSMLAIESRTK